MSTRERLVEAALERLRAGGLDAITTLGVAADVGISQPGIYRHFSNIEELRLEAVARVGRDWLGTIASKRDEMMLGGDALGPAPRATYAAELSHELLEDREMRLLIDRYRRIDDPLGQHIRDLIGVAIDDLVPFLSTQLVHARPDLGSRIERHGDIVRFHAALFVEDVLSFSRVSDEHSLDHAVTVTALLSGRLEANWTALIAHLEASNETT